MNNPSSFFPFKHNYTGLEINKYYPILKNEATWPFDQPFYIVVNMAIGGNFGGHEVDDTIFPQQFLIDYIRVYQ